ncbi:MAG TPA: hypothetical protein VGH83_10315 [Candidatus Acidoferrum sp.]
MTQRHSFAEMKAEQAKLTESWKSEGRLSEAWVVADPEIVELFSAGVAFGVEMGRRGPSEPAYSPDEWRKALREAMEKAAALEGQLQKGRAETLKKE